MTTEDKSISYQTGESEVNFLSILWAAASEPLTSHDKAVCQALIDSLNPGSAGGKFADYECYGEELFTKCILDKLEAHGLLEFTGKPKIKKQESKKPASSKQSKADIIKQDNELRLIAQKIDITLRTFKMRGYEQDMIARQHNQLQSIYLEIRGVSLLYITWSLLHFHGDVNIDLEFAYGVIIGLQKFIKAISDFHPSFSSSLASILKKQLEELKVKYKYSIAQLYTEMPKLIMESPLDEFLPCVMIKPHQHQLDVLNVISKKLELHEMNFCTYRMGTGAGKTFAALLLAEKLRRIRVTTKYEANVRFIYCSAIPSVRRRAAQLFHSFEIPFGFALPISPEIRRKRNLKGRIYIDFSYACRSNAECVALICSPDTAYQLLNKIGESVDEETSVKENRKFNFVLFLDEINYGAEIAGSRELMSHMKLISRAPKWTIVASATLAAGSELKPMLAILDRRYTQVNHIDIHSNIIYGCSNVQTFEGVTFLPHHGCKTLDDLKEAYSKISGNLFLSKMYNPGVLLALQKSIKHFVEWSLSEEDPEELDVALTKLPDIEMIFGDISNLYADNIRIIAMKLLEFMIDFDDDYMVEMICKSPKADDSIEFSKLGTAHAYRFLDSNLIVTENPIELAMSAFDDVLKSIRSRIGSFNKIYNAYVSVMDKWKQAYDKLADVIYKPDELSRRQDEMRDSMPTLEFPNDLQINTIGHIRRNAGESYASSLNKGARVPLNLETLGIDKLNVSEDLIMLLCAGIGVYVNPNKGDLNPNYIKTVLELAASGSLVYLVGDGSLAYGLDMPFASVTICKDFSELHSLNTINQLMSRAGRGKMSFMSRILMDSGCCDKILASIKHTFVDVEMQNMADVLARL